VHDLFLSKQHGCTKRVGLLSIWACFFSQSSSAHGPITFFLPWTLHLHSVNWRIATFYELLRFIHQSLHLIHQGEQIIHGLPRTVTENIITRIQASFASHKFLVWIKNIGLNFTSGQYFQSKTGTFSWTYLKRILTWSFPKIISEAFTYPNLIWVSWNRRHA
jgi:hypothetical protein